MPGKTEYRKPQNDHRVTRSSGGTKAGKTAEKTVHDLLKQAARDLRARKTKCPVDQNVGWLEAEILFADVVDKNKAWVVAHADDYVSNAIRKKFEKFVERRKNHEPVAYILGYKDFYGRRFKVNRNTLIPRPESELFIDVIKLRHEKNDRFMLWDVGTGCGVIAITSALEFPKTKILASDICKRALNVADRNAKTHKIIRRITFMQDDLLGANVKKKLRKSALPLVIAVNLPYLPERDKEKLEEDIVDEEPCKALFGGEDGLCFIKKLLNQINEELTTLPSMILIEFDPPQSKKLLAFANKLFPTATISVHKDLAQKQRLLEIRFE